MDFEQSLLTKKELKYAVVVGRRWFDKRYGNTYHSVTVYGIDANDNQIYLNTKGKYGFADQYKVTAVELLQEAGFDTPTNYGDFIRDSRIYFTVADVTRKKDL